MHKIWCTTSLLAANVSWQKVQSTYASCNAFCHAELSVQSLYLVVPISSLGIQNANQIWPIWQEYTKHKTETTFFCFLFQGSNFLFSLDEVSVVITPCLDAPCSCSVQEVANNVRGGKRIVVLVHVIMYPRKAGGGGGEGEGALCTYSEVRMCQRESLCGSEGRGGEHL